MASKGIYQYTVQESNNAGLGQGGSVYLNTASTTFTPTNGVIVAIQIIGDDATFDTLTPENPEKHFGTATGDLGYESGGNQFGSGVTLTQGTTIFGRFTSVSLAADDSGGGVICYIG